MTEPTAAPQDSGERSHSSTASRADIPPPILEPQSTAASVKTLVKVAIVLAIVAVALVVIGRITTAQGPREAWQACQDHARAQLERPETAAFAGFDDSAVAYQAGHYNVSSSVVSQDSAGEQIQASYSCEVEHARAGRYKIGNFSLTNTSP